MDYTIDRAELLLEKIIDQMPEFLFKDLNGGVVLMDEIKFHPEAKNKDLLIMGKYIRFGVRRQINIYFGSIKYVYKNLSDGDLEKILEEILVHELRHHMEYKANVKDLILEDEAFIKEYKKKV